MYVYIGVGGWEYNIIHCRHVCSHDMLTSLELHLILPYASMYDI